MLFFGVVVGLNVVVVLLLVVVVVVVVVVILNVVVVVVVVGGDCEVGKDSVTGLSKLLLHEKKLLSNLTKIL